MSLLQIHEPGQTPEPHAEDDNTPAIGIDLGTTHSVVALMVNDQPRVIRSADGSALIPSVVAYAETSLKVGTDAVEYPNAIHSIKRLMHEASQVIPTVQGDKKPVEISADILRSCKIRAEEALSADISKAVITVPAYFDDAARSATKDAARLAGLEVLRLVNEPTAAALAYGLDSNAEGIYAIYDLGGGTFDISILRLEKGVFQVLATGGDTQLGGDDFDAAVVELLDSKVSMQQARAIKERLSEEDKIICTPPAGSASSDRFAYAPPSRGEREERNAESDAQRVGGKTVSLTRTQFEQFITPLITRTLTICEQALRDAGVEKNDVQGVVMVGGSTRIPLVQRRVEELFGSAPLTDVNPDEVVAQGAALQAHALTAGSNNLLLDVTPLSLGLETMGGITEKVIHRNTPIPVSMAQEFTTYQDGQTAMKIHVLQGEREKVDDCRSLAHFTLKGIPPMIAGAARIKVNFTVDADGLLTVSAREETTGTEQIVEVKPAYGIDVDTMAQMLDDSMKHAKDDILERLLIEARVEAQRVINDVESAIQHDSHLLEAKEAQHIAMQIERVHKAMESDNRDLIDSEAQLLNTLSNPFAQRRMDRAIGDALKGQKVEDVG